MKFTCESCRREKTGIIYPSGKEQPIRCGACGRTYCLQCWTGVENEHGRIMGQAHPRCITTLVYR